MLDTTCRYEPGSVRRPLPLRGMGPQEAGHWRVEAEAWRS